MASSLFRAVTATATAAAASRYIFPTMKKTLTMMREEESKVQKMAAIKVQLLGYPELHYHHHQQQQQTTPNPPNKDSNSATSTTSSNSPSFMDLMEANFNNTTMNHLPPPQPLMGRTENFSPTFLSSGNPCIDFFFHIVPGTPPESLTQRLELAWKQDPLTTLKLVCNLRGVRDTGKSDKEGFYAAALWLHANHPKTLAGNVKWFADFGYFKDLPEILFRLLEGLDVRKKAEEERPRRTMNSRRMRARMKSRRMRMMRMGMSVDDEETVDVKKSRKEKYIEKRKKAMDAKKLRKERIIDKGKKALERYYNDEDYRFLHDRISDLFAEYLISDLKLLNSGEVEQINQISLASKWCPNLDSSFDRATLLCESIARRVFPREEYPEYDGIEDAHYAYRVRDRLRKQYLVPLHRALELPEVYMSSKKWDSLPYNRVPSVAMKNYKSFFEKHDEERFKEYLEKVKSGKATIAAGALLPHEIIASLEHVYEGDNKDKNDVAELQWQRMVKDVTEKGKLRDCLAICDVSGSMSGTPMEVCVALGLLVSEMNEDPWKGKVITFSKNPQLHKIEGEDLYSKTNFIRQMDWGMNTDFQKVFDLILQVAINGKLREDQMIKRLFVFSDMEFDEASFHSQNPNGYYQPQYGQYGYQPQYGQYGSSHSQNPYGYYQPQYGQYGYYGTQTGVYENNNNTNNNNWETDYEAIKRKYEESGYGNSVPQIVFWNLRDSTATPVMGEQKGVALVSGFSKNLLTLFLDDMVENMTPTHVMEMAISGKEYQQLVELLEMTSNYTDCWIYPDRCRRFIWPGIICYWIQSAAPSIRLEVKYTKSSCRCSSLTKLLSTKRNRNFR